MDEFTVFNRSGLASLEDLTTPEWKQCFEKLEKIQSDFLFHHPHSGEYQWPIDPLHTCIRVWEYPFIYTNLNHIRQSEAKKKPVIIDLGSGATFFPFAIAQLDCDVIAMDFDIQSGTSLNNAKKDVTTGQGSLAFIQGDAYQIPLGDQSADHIYCISVLEHLPNPDRVIAEIARVLRPGGRLLLTFDIDLKGNSAIGPEQYETLRAELERLFVTEFPEKFIHPLNILTSDNSVYPYYSKLSWLASLKQSISQLTKGKIFSRSYRKLATTYGLCLILK